MISICRWFDSLPACWPKLRRSLVAWLMLAAVMASSSSAAPPAAVKKASPVAGPAPTAQPPAPTQPQATAQPQTAQPQTAQPQTTPPQTAQPAAGQKNIPPARPAAAKVTTPAVPARLDTYLQPDGTGCFALTLPPLADLPRVAGHDIVVLFDTSASQVGEARARGLKTLRTLLSMFESPDRVQLMAVDVGVVPLTTNFVSPESSELKAALEQLVRRVPLGATDFPLALSRAAAAFSSAEANAKAVVYIGDGVSAAQLFTPQSFAKLTAELVEMQVPVFSYGLGPRVDSQLLAALANYTGGTIVLDDASVDPKEAGLFLAVSARGPVAWVDATTWPKALDEIYPRALTPLRGDRETVIIGKGLIAAPIEIDATGQTAGRAWQRRWSATPTPPSDDFSYLPLLLGMAEKDGGTTLPILGAEGLKQIGHLFLTTAAELITLGRQALSTDNFDDADRLTDEALRRDPKDPEALALRQEIAKRRSAQKKAAVEQPKSKPPAATPSVAKPAKAPPDKAKRGKASPPKAKPAAPKPATPAKPAAGEAN